MERKFRLKYIVYLLIGFYLITFSLISIRRLNLFYLHALDFGTFDNALWNTLHGRFMYSSVQNCCYFGVHFAPLLLLIAPFYLLWNDPRMLLIIQTFTIALGALPLYLIAKDKLKNGFVALAFAFAYLLSPLLQKANLSDYHAVTLQPSLVLFAFYFLQKKRFGNYFIFLGLLLLAREDTFLYCFGFGIYGFLFQRERKVGLATILLALAWGLMAIKVFIPWIRGGEYPMIGLYTWLGDNFFEIAKTLVLHPFYVLRTLWTPMRIRGLLLLLVPVGFLPLFSGGALILFLIPLLQMLLSSHRYIMSLSVHYSTPIYPFLFIAAVYGVYYLTRPKRLWFLKIVIGIYLIAAGARASYYYGYAPFSKNFSFICSPLGLHNIIGHKFIKEFVKPIPEESSLCAENSLYTHLAHRKEVYYYRGNDRFPFGSGMPDPYRIKGINYIFLDVHSKNKGQVKDYHKNLIQLLYEKKYGVVAYQDGYLLLKRGASAAKNEETYEKIFILFESERHSRKCGQNLFDAQASGGIARYGSVESDGKGHLVFGRYRIYPAGEYRVDYRLKAGKRIPEVIAHLDVSANKGRTILAKKVLRGTDFKEPEKYQLFSLNFQLPKETMLEFRVWFADKSDLWADFIHPHAGPTLEEKYNSYSWRTEE